MAREVSTAEYSGIEMVRGRSDARGRSTMPRSSVERIWAEVGKASFAIVSYVTPTGEPRSSGVVYAVRDHHLYLAVASDSGIGVSLKAMIDPVAAQAHVPIT